MSDVRRGVLNNGGPRCCRRYVYLLKKAEILWGISSPVDADLAPAFGAALHSVVSDELVEAVVTDRMTAG